MDIREIMQALDEDPSLLEELRARILTRELLEMPTTLAILTERMDTLTEQVGALTERMDALTERMDTFTERMDALTERMDTLTERMDALTERMDALTERMDALTERMDALTERMDTLTEQVGAIAISLNTLIEASERRFERLSNDIGVLRGWYSEQTVSRQAVLIAIRVSRSKGLRFRYESEITSAELSYMAAPFASEIDLGDLDSFYLADLVMQVRDEDTGDDAYIAVEASYTCDTRDTARAVRNVRFIERFTGKRAYAGVAGIRMDSLIHDSIESGDVFWHQLEEPR